MEPTSWEPDDFYLNSMTGWRLEILKTKLETFVSSVVYVGLTPSRASHFGGLWESGVRSTKTILAKIVRPLILTVDELYTVLTSVEATLNSRPLIPLDSAPADGMQALTPGHFLVGRPLLALPEKTDFSTKTTTLRRWNLCQRLIAEYWNRWSKEYLYLLHRYHKWRHPKREVQVGDLVMLKDDSWFERAWPMARVLEVYPGKDGHVRAATVKTLKGIYLRPVARMVPLMTEEELNKPLLPGEGVQAPRSLQRKIVWTLSYHKHMVVI